MQNIEESRQDLTASAGELSSASLPRSSNASLEAALIMKTLPERHEPFADKYFLRSEEILRAEGLNPWVKAQIMVRKGPGVTGGINEAVAMLSKYTALKENGGKVWAKEEGASFEPCESVMFIEGPIRDIVALETMYLGAISAETTRLNDGIEAIDLAKVTENMRAIVEATGGRPVIYMGARHWSWKEDAAISYAAFLGGAATCSTDAGAGAFGSAGVGTIPHVLENIYAWKFGRERAVLESTLAFDRNMPADIPRVALVDYNNREIDDALLVAEKMGNRLSALRVDTCGENIPQGGLISPHSVHAATFKEKGIRLPALDDPDSRYWYGTGVTITGVLALRMALNEAGYPGLKIILSSGFGDVEKVKAFVRAEKETGIQLFDSLGVGGVYKSRAATMDVVMVGDSPETLAPCSKTGRSHKPNTGLNEVSLLERQMEEGLHAGG